MAPKFRETTDHGSSVPAAPRPSRGIRPLLPEDTRKYREDMAVALVHDSAEVNGPFITPQKQIEVLSTSLMNLDGPEYSAYKTAVHHTIEAYQTLAHRRPEGSEEDLDQIQRYIDTLCIMLSHKKVSAMYYDIFDNIKVQAREINIRWNMRTSNRALEDHQVVDGLTLSRSDNEGEDEFYTSPRRAAQAGTITMDPIPQITLPGKSAAPTPRRTEFVEGNILANLRSSDEICQKFDERSTKRRTLGRELTQLKGSGVSGFFKRRLHAKRIHKLESKLQRMQRHIEPLEERVEQIDEHRAGLDQKREGILTRRRHVMEELEQLRNSGVKGFFKRTFGGTTKKRIARLERDLKEMNTYLANQPDTRWTV